MSNPAEVRIYSSVALLVVLLVIGRLVVDIGVAQFYFPDEPQIYRWGIVATGCAVAVYLIACIRQGHLVWSEEAE
ncbi:hypothetical protein [Anatilimnocola floriformis]|uniref:hypothetical protein n=1 Tax=Anatilimnocola floriformis TaxID=2948575 RepID=UPI0020C413B0|nr:hypothetical protein [Anatilimnocola floriformis]